MRRVFGCLPLAFGPIPLTIAPKGFIRRKERCMTPLKLSAIDQEHLQELYDASGVARDELPYTEAYETIWQGFQDRTFKNATRDQLYGALLKYTRSSTNASKPMEAVPLTDDQKKLLKLMVAKHGLSGKVLPY